MWFEGWDFQSHRPELWGEVASVTKGQGFSQSLSNEASMKTQKGSGEPECFACHRAGPQTPRGPKFLV